jgi:AhpD family alkylhydroperoxidase
MWTSMPRFQIHQPNGAPAPGAREYLRAVHAARGHVPNLMAVLAESEAALRVYGELSTRYGEASLSLLERQVVMMTVTRLNAATYCMAGHSAIAAAAGMSAEQIDALREGHALDDARLEALRRFTEAAYYCRGKIDGGTWAAFGAAGYGNAQALEVLVGIALKVFTNFAARMTEVPVDPLFESWMHVPLEAGRVRP